MTTDSKLWRSVDRGRRLHLFPIGHVQSACGGYWRSERTEQRQQAKCKRCLEALVDAGKVTRA